MKFVLPILLMVVFSAQAVAKENIYRVTYEGCNSIQDPDKKAYCQAIDANKASICNKIGNNDLQNKCLAKTNNDAKFCKRINDERKRKSCEQYIR
jgi:hypothetical protein